MSMSAIVRVPPYDPQKRITLPKDVRKELGIESGDWLVITVKKLSVEEIAKEMTLQAENK